jgi:hypothetical protein
LADETLRQADRVNVANLMTGVSSRPSVVRVEDLSDKEVAEIAKGRMAPATTT